MSDNLRYQGALTPEKLEEWKITLGETNGKAILHSGGSLVYAVNFTSTADQGLPEKYKVVVTYDSPPEAFVDKVLYNFKMEFAPTQKEDKTYENYKVIQVNAHANTYIGSTRRQSVVYVKSGGGTTKQLKMTYSNDSDYDVTINSIAVYPSYAMDQQTIEEMETYMPSILHYQNESVIEAQGLMRLVSMDISTTMDTNLQVHLMINGRAAYADTIQLAFKINGEHAAYSPLEFDIPAGKFVMGLPLNLMQVESGNKKFEIHMESTSRIDIAPYKLQCTVEGKGMINKSGASAPSAFETVSVPVLPIYKPETNTTSMIALDTHAPVAVINGVSVPAKTLRSFGKVTQLTNHELVRVAEDVWFGPVFENGFDDCAHEIFRYNKKALEIADGSIRFLPSYSRSTKLKLHTEENYGSIYSIDVDNTNTRAYERLQIEADRMSVTTRKLTITSQSYDVVDGYTLDETLKVIIRYPETSTQVTTDGENYTYTETPVETSNYNDVSCIE